MNNPHNENLPPLAEAEQAKASLAQENLELQQLGSAREDTYEKDIISIDNKVNPTTVQAQPISVSTQDLQQDQPGGQSGVSASAQTDSPLVADDVDVIEKEWVDKAKKIIELTADDPYAQENEIEKLQIDYLYKRFGKKIKSSEK